MIRKKLRSLVTEYSERNKGCNCTDVYSVTNSQGFVPSTDYFSKEVFSKDLSTYKVVRNGMIAYNPSRINVGSVAVQRAAEQVIVSPLYVVFSVNETELLPEFLSYYLHSDAGLQQIAAHTSGSVRDSLKFTALQDIEINQYSIETQNEMILTLTKIESVIQKRKLILKKLDDLIMSKFSALFGSPETNAMQWEKCCLSEVMVKSNNGLSRRGNDADGDIVLRLVEVQEGYIDYSNPNRIKLNSSEKERYRLIDNDFLFARVNGNPSNVGRCAVFKEIDEAVYHNDHTIRVHFDMTRVDSRYLSILLNSQFGKKQMRRHIKTSAGQYTISQDGISVVEVLLPSIELQKEFGCFVEQVERAKESAKQNLEQLETCYKALLQQYFG